ncbi:MAG: hypothetical protein RL022_400 [Chloroflexota bacterium]
MSLIVHGTEDTSTDPVPVTVGNWSFMLIGGAVRVICWRGVEVVRGIDCPLRDPSWATLVPDDVTMAWTDQGHARVLTRTFTAADRALSGTVVVTVDPAGTLEADLRLVAHRDFATNRSGFTVLHPIDGIAGSPLTVRHSDGHSEETHFPETISPSQPVFDIAGLAHEVGGVHVDLSFEGEVFEMEDQRNWIDASYKTYCRPIARPLPYVIPAGETVHHRIRLTVSGDAHPANPGTRALGGGDDHPGTFPELLMAAQDGWVPDPASGHPALGVGVGSHLIRIGAHATGAEAWIGAVARVASTVDLEVVVPEAADPDAHLASVAAALHGQGIAPRHVFALPEAYLKSYQPTAQWPTGTSPAQAVAAAGRAFPSARIGVGMLTNFTELNRCRPVDAGSYVTHSTTAIVHAADDRSVFETLETLPRILADTTGFAHGADGSRTRSVRLGLMSIGMRSNAYGVAVAPNPGRIRKAMAMDDPRQTGLIAASYAVGVASQVARGGAEAFALSSFAGSFGVADAEVRHPIFHAVRVLGQFAGHPLVALPDQPGGVHGVAVTVGSGHVRAAIANCTDTTQPVSLPVGATYRILDETTAREASLDGNWSGTAPAAQAGTDGQVMVARYGVVFAEWV